MLILSSRPSRFFAKAIRRSSRIIPRFWVYSGHDFSKFSSSARLSATVESRLASFEFACSCFFHPSSARIFALGRPWTGLDRGLRVARIYERVRPRRVKGFGEKRYGSRSPTNAERRTTERREFVSAWLVSHLTNENDTATSSSKRRRANGEDFIGVQLMGSVLIFTQNDRAFRVI